MQRGDENPTLKWKKDLESRILAVFEWSRQVTLGGKEVSSLWPWSVRDMVLDQFLLSLSTRPQLLPSKKITSQGHLEYGVCRWWPLFSVADNFVPYLPLNGSL